MGLIATLAEDARELAKARRRGVGEPLALLEAAPSTREALREAATQDGYKVLVLTRLREVVRRHRIPGGNHLLRMLTRIVYGIDVGNEVVLGPGLNFTHTLGTVIGGTSVIGARVQFMGSNTIGTAKENGCPMIEADVVLGCGARVLGPVRVGRGAVIGANAVVLSDVPAGATAVGIPARVVPPEPLHVVEAAAGS